MYHQSVVELLAWAMPTTTQLTWQTQASVAYTARKRVTKFKFRHADVLHIHVQARAPAGSSPVMNFVTSDNPPAYFVSCINLSSCQLISPSCCQLISPTGQLTHQDCQAYVHVNIKY
jgi:hypothetical protein